MACERHNMLNPQDAPKKPYVTQCLEQEEGVVVAASDYVKLLPDGIARWIPSGLTSLGTDGFGRSDYRKALRRFFEVDRHHVVVAALRSLGRDEDAVKAIAQYEIDSEAGAPWQR